MNTIPFATPHFQSSSSSVSIIVGGIVVALIFLGIVLFFRKVKQDAAKLQVRIAQATPAEARVIQVGRSILQKEQGTVNVRLRLEISPKDRPRYQTTVTWDVENAALPKVQEGCRVGVKIDPENPNIIYPRVGWAEFNWVYSDTEKKGER
jgi:hypothetical protein